MINKDTLGSVSKEIPAEIYETIPVEILVEVPRFFY